MSFFRAYKDSKVSFGAGAAGLLLNFRYPLVYL